LFRQFALPPGGRPILSYLRLGDLGETESPDLEAHWRRLEETIPPDRGLFERLRRCCLLPCTLPEQAREAVRALVPEEAIPLLKRLRVTLHGTIGRLHLLDISLTLIDVFPEALEPAQAQVVNRLSDAGETEVRLLASLADLSWRALDNAREEDDQTTTAQLLSAWVHASFVADLMLATATDAERVVGHLRRLTGVQHRDLFANAQSPRRDLAWRLGLAPAELCLIGLGGVLARHHRAVDQLLLDGGARERISSLLNCGNELPPDIMLLRNPYLPTDRLGCLWGGDRATKLSAFIETDAATIFAAAAFEERMDEALEALINDPLDFATWVSLSFQVGYAPLPDEAGQRLNAVLAQLPLERLAATAIAAEATAVMDLAVTHARDRDRIAGCLFGWAEAMDSGEFTLESWARQNGAGAEDAFADRLIQWSLLLASRHPDEPDAAFARLIDGLMLRSTRVCELLIEPLLGISRTLPFARHKAMHRSLLCARARV
jgi:hypothetical protein